MKIMYNVDEANNVVVAFFKGGKSAWYDYLYHKVMKRKRAVGNCISIDPLYLDDVIEGVLGEMKLYAKAKCHPGDNFNPNVGAKLASQRLIEKLERAEFRVMDIVEKKVEALAWEFLRKELKIN